jgi:hypothetical protein
MLQKCSLKSAKSSFKCNYIEFGENSSVTFNEIDSSIADFWNEIDTTMVQKNKQRHIEVIQVLKESASRDP